MALSADGNTALVGAPGDNSNLGAAWVFTRSGGVWSQQGEKLIGAGAIQLYNGIKSFGVSQGSSVALSADGNTALVGGPGDNDPGTFGVWGIGAVWVFTRTGGVWSQQGDKLVGTGYTGIAPTQGGWVALSADGNTAMVGGCYDDPSAGVWVFARSGGVWSQQGNELVGTGQSRLGSCAGALSADGNTAAVLGRTDTSPMVWVFQRSAGVWAQNGPGFAVQGVSLALSADGNTMAGGDTEIDPGFSIGVGAVRVFTRSGDTWSQKGTRLVGSDAVNGAAQGTAVAVSADASTVLVGGDGDNGMAGAAWVFVAGSPGPPSPSTTTLSSSPNPSVVGQTVTFTATVTAGATGTVTFSIDGVAQAPLALWNSQAQPSISNLSPGTHSVSAIYYGDTNFSGSTSNEVMQDVTEKPSTISLSTSPNPSINGQIVTFTATVTAGATGTVTFTIDGVAQAPAALMGSQAQLTISNLSPGTHSVFAIYGGDATFSGSTSNKVVQDVNEPSTISLSASPNPSINGQMITFTATVTTGATGTVTFTIDGAQTTVPLSGGQAQIATADLIVGAHVISATYNGDANFLSSTRTVLTQTVTPVTSLRLTLTSSASPSAVGQPVTFTASLTGGTAPYAGTVQFFDNSVSLGTIGVASGQAALTTSALTAGLHTILAKYTQWYLFTLQSAQTTVVQMVDSCSADGRPDARPAVQQRGNKPDCRLSPR